MPHFRLACLTYLCVALPGSTLGLLWPSMRLSLGEPVGALGVVLAFSVAATVVSSVVTGHVVARVPVGLLLATGTMVSGLALAVEAAAPSLLVLTGGSVLFGLGFGAISSALNAHAACNFGPRDITWIHASYGLGAIIGPLLVTALLSGGLSWRVACWIFAAVQGVLGCVLAVAHRDSQSRPRTAAARSPRPGGHSSANPAAAAHGRLAPAVILGALIVIAVETGIETGAGIWGYLFLTAGRGMSHEVAGAAISAYWAMMFAGRAVLGPVAERVGASRVLGGAIAGVAVGAALMVLPGPGFVAIIAMMIVGLAAAPIFPLLALTTADLSGAGNAATMRAVGLQVAASSIGSAVLPAGMGLAIGAFDATVLAPLLLVLSLAMCVVYALIRRPASA